ncbi:MAG TPA: cytochrome C nitrite reductase [bacterium]|nr:cytochrome C nitrite reductase [bacterium]
MKRWGRFAAVAICLTVAFSLLFGLNGQAQNAGYHQIALIQLPGIPPQSGSFSYDISWVDPSTHRYYLADRSGNGIDVVDTKTNRFLYRMAQGQFVGNTGKTDTSGPDGILVIADQQIAWVGDGKSRVKAIDVRTGLVLTTISTGTTNNRADELAYDPVDHLIAVANNADDPPFVTFISTTDRRAVGKIVYTDATDGVEQAVYEPVSRMFYLSVPATKAEPGGRIDRIDPKTMQIAARFPVSNCHPGGLTVGPRQQLLIGCSEIYAEGHAQSIVIDARDGHVVAAVQEVGASDEVWYNSGDNHYYLAARNMTANGMKGGTVTPVLGIVDASTNRWIQNLPTGAAAHSVAVDPTNNHIFVPVPNGIAVFSL